MFRVHCFISGNKILLLITYLLCTGSNTLDPLLAKLAMDYVDDHDLSLRLAALFKVWPNQ